MPQFYRTYILDLQRRVLFRCLKIHKFSRGMDGRHPKNKGQQEFRILSNLSTPKQSGSINKMAISLTPTHYLY